MNSKRISFITYLNVYASFAVVMLHNNGIVWLHPTGRTWYSAIFIETFFYCAVPLFFMITGCTLIDYSRKYSIKEFFIKRINKTLIPFIAWSFIGIIYLCLSNQSWYNLQLPISEIISNILNTNYIGIYWFFIPLFSTYMCIPILDKISDKMHVFKYMIILGFVFVGILPFICNVMHINYNYELVPKMINGFVLYSILEYYLSHKELTVSHKKIVYTLGIIGFLTNFVGTAILTDPETGINELFRGAFNWPCLFQTIAFFVFFQNIKFNEKIEVFFNWLSTKTFGIYLIHIYLVWEIPKLFNISMYSLVWRILGGFLIYLLSALIVSLLQKIPVIKKIVP